MDYSSEIKNLIEILMKEGGSDLHLSAGNPPIIRVSGALTPLSTRAVLTGEDTAGIISVLLSKEQKDSFFKNQEVD